jgi:hypothetical protein
MASELLTSRLNELLSKREHPKTICPSEVARSLSKEELGFCNATNWRDLMPRIRELAWERRCKGELEVLQKGEVLDEEVALENVRGPIRLRRRASSSP